MGSNPNWDELCFLSTILEKLLKYLSISLVSKAAHFLVAHFQSVAVCKPPWTGAGLTEAKAVLLQSHVCETSWMRTMKNDIVFKNTHNSKIHFSVHLVKSLLSLPHLSVAEGKLFNLFKPKGIITPNLIKLSRGCNEMMHGRLWPKYLELRRSLVDARDGYYLST